MIRTMLDATRDELKAMRRADLPPKVRDRIELGARQVRRRQKRMGPRHRRTGSTLRHEQGPAEADRAGRVPRSLKGPAAAGRLMYFPPA